ncbi:hypothetical protein Purlil1_6426 [Purpureocillium lilacinum]|uniref:Podoplanin domain-containing protein n=1 Tax=Purpureocillium lilacinum TaxID=33203 RepID=A0ABR0BZI5_PURLI|nr:hypothetical protein Purlil1_6426 [Purpureocillium lilacinum]
MELTTLLTTLSLVSGAAAQTCYWPNGSEADNLLPCSHGPDPEYSTCCFKGHYGLSNGLCFEPLGMTMYRAGCTDRTFNSQSCASFCYGDKYEISVGASQSGVWTCGDNKFACTPFSCSANNFTVPASKMLQNAALLSDIGQLSATATATTAGSATATGSVVTHTVTSPANSTSEQCDTTGGVSTGGAVGIGVGIGAPLALATAGLLVMYLRERRRRQAFESGTWPSPHSKGVHGEVSGDSTVRSEMMASHHQRHELGT